MEWKEGADLIDFPSTPKLFLNTVQKLRSKTALRFKEKGIWHEISWEEYRRRAFAVAKALIREGIRKGDRVSLIGENRWEWVVTDLGIACAGAIAVGLYPTLAPEQILYAVNHSESRLIFVEGEEQLDKVLEILDRTQLEKVIVWDRRGLWGFSHPKVQFFDEFLGWSNGEFGVDKEVSDEEVLRRIDSIRPDDVALIVYTSGTTGNPKGAMITHKNLIFMSNSLARSHGARETDEVLSYLPLNHIAERLLSVYQAIRTGYTVSFVESFETLPENLREVRPTFFFSVPRIWEKIASNVQILMKDSTPFKRLMWRWAFDVGRRWAEAFGREKEKVIAEIKKEGKWKEELEKLDTEGKKNFVNSVVRKRIPLSLRIKYFIAYNLVLRHIKRILGFDRIRYALCGAAPSAPELYIFFNALGIPLAEGYGQTESSGVITITRPGFERWGYVGEKIEGIEVKIAPDGEILTRGPHVFAGYWRDPALTSETIKDGWLHTGDVGQIDELGYLKILDRKKDIIITAGGKNITPSYIENKLKFSPYIQDAVVVGEGRKYLVALILIDEDNVARWAQENSIPFTTFEDLAKNPKVYKLIEKEVEKVNKTLSRVEQIKKFALIPRRLYEEEGDITPTRKIKRKVIERKYKDLIEKLYAEK